MLHWIEEYDESDNCYITFFGDCQRELLICTFSTEETIEDFLNRYKITTLLWKPLLAKLQVLLEQPLVNKKLMVLKQWLQNNNVI